MQSETSELEMLAGFPVPLILETVWAEGEDAGLLDAGADDTSGDAGDDGAGEADAGGETEGQQEQGQQEEKIDGRRGSKEFREALKAWEATPEGAKHAKQARADHFRVQELGTIEPGGVTAIREKYALLESVGGPAAITQMQERIAEVDQTDALIASGDPKGLESLGPDFDPGLAKLMPTILERVMRANPEAYSNALLPHLMNGLVSSPMVGDLNSMIDVLTAPHLDEKAKIQAITQALGRIGQWFEQNEKKAGQLKTAPVDKGRQELDQQRAEFEQQQQTAHWNNNIGPQVASFETQKLNELFAPYDKRLGLDAEAKKDLFDTFKSKMKAAGQADQAYMKQMALYRKQKNPDPAVVANFVKAAINRHAKNVVEGAVKARYGKFLGTGVKKATATTQTGARAATGGAGAAAVVVSAKPDPEDVDYRKTSEQDQWKGLYTLKSGKRVQYRKPA